MQKKGNGKKGEQRKNKLDNYRPKSKYIITLNINGIIKTIKDRSYEYLKMQNAAIYYL